MEHLCYSNQLYTHWLLCFFSQDQPPPYQFLDGFGRIPQVVLGTSGGGRVPQSPRGYATDAGMLRTFQQRIKYLNCWTVLSQIHPMSDRLQWSLELAI